MKLRSIAVLFAFAVASAIAQAQSGVYATFTAEEFNRSGLLVNPPAGSSNSDTPWLYGPTVGAYYTIHRLPFLPAKYGTLHTGPIAIGIDGRGDFLRTNTAYSRDDGIISLRISPKKPIFKSIVYLQGGAGVGHVKIPGPIRNFTNSWSYQFAAGIDRKIKGHLDWRVVEVGGGFLGDYVAGNNENNSNYNLAFRTGIVYRFSAK